jgi:hypothetical protein
MASSYITSAQKAFINSAFDNIHETFSRTITVISNPQMTVISSSPTYNYFYDKDSGASTVQYSENKQTFKARIKYINNNLENMPGSNAADKLAIPAGTVKIKVAEDGYIALKEARKVEFDGRRYSIVSDNKPYGMFGPKYYSFILSPINE